MGNETEEGDGGRLEQVCRRRKLICSNTYFKHLNGNDKNFDTRFSRNG